LGVARQLAGDLGDAVLHHLQRHHHVGRGRELRRDLRRAADAARADAPDPGHRHDHLLDRAGDDQRHRLRRQRARVRDDDDAGKLQRRVDAAGQAIGGDDAADYQRRRQQANGARMLQRLAGDVHVDEPFSGAPRAGSFSFSPAGSPATLIAASSGSPAWPSTITWSPALIPDRISTLVPSLSPIWTGRRLAFVPLATKTAASSPSRTIATTGTRTTPRCSSASMSTCTGAPTGRSAAPANPSRTGMVAVPASTAAGREITFSAASALPGGPGDSRAAAPTSIRGASASGTAATISSRDGSITRSTGSPALGSTRSPGLCDRLATRPSKVARTTARRASACEDASDARACASAAPASATPRVASSTS